MLGAEQRAVWLLPIENDPATFQDQASRAVVTALYTEEVTRSPSL